MRAATKVAVYLAGLVVVFAGAFGVGALVGDPISEPAPSESHPGEDHPVPGQVDADPESEPAAEVDG